MGYACRHSGACCTARWPIPIERDRALAVQAAIAAGRVHAPDGLVPGRRPRHRRTSPACLRGSRAGRACSTGPMERRRVCRVPAAAPSTHCGPSPAATSRMCASSIHEACTSRCRTSARPRPIGCSTWTSRCRLSRDLPYRSRVSSPRASTHERRCRQPNSVLWGRHLAPHPAPCPPPARVPASSPGTPSANGSGCWSRAWVVIRVSRMPRASARSIARGPRSSPAGPGPKRLPTSCASGIRWWLPSGGAGRTSSAAISPPKLTPRGRCTLARARRPSSGWWACRGSCCRSKRARACLSRGRGLDRPALTEAVRQADLLLVHYADPFRFHRHDA